MNFWPLAFYGRLSDPQRLCDQKLTHLTFAVRLDNWSKQVWGDNKSLVQVEKCGYDYSVFVDENLYTCKIS